MNRSNKGITLIALVVTIIVLLILAGVSINMLTGQNGILNRAQEAKEQTETSQADENNKLQGYENIINSYANNLPTGEGTMPYLPNDTFSYKEGDLSSGLVIKDANNNEYVWVEVSTTIYDNTEYNSNGANKPRNSEDYTNIEACLKAYTIDYNNSNYSDTNPIFLIQYQYMLKSVYENGGFWIGRYEAGIEGDTPKTEHNDIKASDKAVVKQNMYPYSYVTRDEAQELAKRMNYENCTSSLIFGLQWNLVLKYIENKNATAQSNLTSTSTSIGNYYNSEFVLNRGKFAQYNDLSKWYMYNSEDKTDLITKCRKIQQSSYEKTILLTTGATDASSLQKIYDIAGNVGEWTLEFYNTNNASVNNGGGCNYRGSDYPAKVRCGYNTDFYDFSVGFRIGVWK